MSPSPKSRRTNKILSTKGSPSSFNQIVTQSKMEMAAVVVVVVVAVAVAVVLRRRRPWVGTTP